MIKIDQIDIEDFRGIRSISLNPGSANYVVVGPNGSGKSGVIDAIDFALTGSIRRLVGEGTGGLTVRAHGPHVTQTATPERARVILVVRATGSDEVATLTRTIEQPNEFALVPDLPNIRDAIQTLGEHPETTLSRREIVKFVMAQPAGRAKDVQTLLRLDRLRTYRENLMKASN